MKPKLQTEESWTLTATLISEWFLWFFCTCHKKPAENFHLTPLEKLCVAGKTSNGLQSLCPSPATYNHIYMLLYLHSLCIHLLICVLSTLTMELLIAILLCARATEKLLSLMMKTPQPDPEKPASSQLPLPLTADYCLDKHEAKSHGAKNRKPSAMSSSWHWIKNRSCFSATWRPSVLPMGCSGAA